MTKVASHRLHQWQSLDLSPVTGWTRIYPLRVEIDDAFCLTRHELGYYLLVLWNHLFQISSCVCCLRKL